MSAAEHYYRLCLTAWRSQNFNRGLGAVLVFLGETLRLSGRPTAAAAAVREGLQIGRAPYDVVVTALALRELGALALERGDLDEAHLLIGKSCDYLRETDDVAAYVRSRALLVRLEVRSDMFAAAGQGCIELLHAVRNSLVLSLADAAYGVALLLAAERSDQQALAADRA